MHHDNSRRGHAKITARRDSFQCHGDILPLDRAPQKNTPITTLIIRTEIKSSIKGRDARRDRTPIAPHRAPIMPLSRSHCTAIGLPSRRDLARSRDRALLSRCDRAPEAPRSRSRRAAIALPSRSHRYTIALVLRDRAPITANHAAFLAALSGRRIGTIAATSGIVAAKDAARSHCHRA